MGKAFAAFIQFLLFIALSGVVAYNYYEIAQLKAEVALLRGGGGAKLEQGKKSDLTSIQHHAERAQEFLRKQDYEAAKRELEAAAKTVREASSEVSERTSRTLEQLRKTVTDLSKGAETLTGSAQKMIDGHRNEPGTTKGGSNGGKSE
jgi:methyl-accepting chemotaxis protein